MFSKMWIVVAFCTCMCIVVAAEDLSRQEMMAITGACLDCNGTEAGDRCKYDNPCKGCYANAGIWNEDTQSWEYQSPSGCPNDTEQKDYYPGATLADCTSQVLIDEGPPPRYANPNTGNCSRTGDEHECHRKYWCTSDSVVNDLKCESEEVQQCTTTEAGSQCRRCKLGSAVSGLQWAKEKDDECNAPS